jgi:DNA polymerase III alpha subunit
MKIDKYGQFIFDENDLLDLYLIDPSRKLSNILSEDEINNPAQLELDRFPNIISYMNPDISVTEFDNTNQNIWHFPDAYKNMDIAQYVLEQCKTDAELQRAGQELLLFQERDMFMLLKYLKYLVDTMRENNIVWGVGRGSSVASFVLFLLGVHKINSLYYDLSIDEFLK